MEKFPRKVKAVKSAMEERESRLRGILRKKGRILVPHVHRPFSRDSLPGLSKRTRVKLLGRLYVIVHEAQYEEIQNEKCSYIASVTFGTQVKKTKLLSNPKWNDNFVFDVFDEDTAEIYIDVVGQPQRSTASPAEYSSASVSIPLRNFFDGNTHDDTYDMETHASSGGCTLRQIHLSIQYKRENSDVDFDVLQIQNQADDVSLPISIDAEERQLIEGLSSSSPALHSARSEGEDQHENDEDLSSTVVQSDIVDYDEPETSYDHPDDNDDDNKDTVNHAHGSISYNNEDHKNQNEHEEHHHDEHIDGEHEHEHEHESGLHINTGLHDIDEGSEDLDINSIRRYMTPSATKSAPSFASIDLKTIQELRECISSVREMETALYPDIDSRLEKIETKVSDLETHILKLNSNNDNTSNQITDCKEDCHSNTQKIAKLEERIESLEQKQQGQFMFYILQFTIGLLSTIVKIFGTGFGWTKSMLSSSSSRNDSSPGSLGERFEHIQQSFREQSAFLSQLSAKIGGGGGNMSSDQYSDRTTSSYDSLDEYDTDDDDEFDSYDEYFDDVSDDQNGHYDHGDNDNDNGDRNHHHHHHHDNNLYLNAMKSNGNSNSSTREHDYYSHNASNENRRRRQYQENHSHASYDGSDYSYRTEYYDVHEDASDDASSSSHYSTPLPSSYSSSSSPLADGNIHANNTSTSEARRQTTSSQQRRQRPGDNHRWKGDEEKSYERGILDVADEMEQVSNLLTNKRRRSNV